MEQTRNYNQALIKGEIKEIFDSCNFLIGVKRLSGYEDLIKVKHFTDEDFSVGDIVAIYGQVEVESRFDKNIRKRRSHPYIYAKEISNGFEIEDDYRNAVILSGRIAKKPNLRLTYSDIPIADIVVSTLGRYGIIYVNCISWFNKAKRFAHCEVNDPVSLEGRFQSREYNKIMDDGSIEVRTAYEISIDNFSLEN